MITIKDLRWIPLLLLLLTTRLAFALQAPQEQMVVVGHLSYVEGELLRYVHDSEEWVATEQDTPFGIDDIVHASENAKAEIVVPNNTLIRIGSNTKIQTITLGSDLTEVAISKGIARVYNKSSTTIVKVKTPFGYVEAPPLTTFEVQVKEESTEIRSLKGKISFFHLVDNASYEVVAGLSSLIAGDQRISAGEGMVDESWNSWNVKRDTFWKRRVEVQGDSTDYLPEQLHYGAYTLEENGNWEKVYYEGSYRYLWRPLYVSSGWAPFTVGRWITLYEDHCWVPFEPFGYLTHHYGNWVFIERYHRWYWAPPVRYLRIEVGPSFGIDWGWYPGLVYWIHRDTSIGWIPLAPCERYFCHRFWGPRSVIISNPTSHTLHVNNFKYRNHSVMVERRDFYKRSNYRHGVSKNRHQDTLANGFYEKAVSHESMTTHLRKHDEGFKSIDAHGRGTPLRSSTNSIRPNELLRSKFLPREKAITGGRNENLKDRGLASPTFTRFSGNSSRVHSVRGISEGGYQRAFKSQHYLNQRTTIGRGGIQAQSNFHGRGTRQTHLKGR